MNRPYIVCNMMTALDGKITGPYMETPEAEVLYDEYNRIRAEYPHQAWMCGRVTMDDNFTFYQKPEINKNHLVYPRTDFVAAVQEKIYVVAADPSGRLAWKQNYLDYLDRPRSHIIEVLTDKVSDDYIAYLREHNISYIFAGRDRLDCTLAVEKLYKLFGIELLLLEGGGFLNWSFQQEDLIDELSLIIAPLADGSQNTVTLFEKADYLPPKAVAKFNLQEVQRIKGDGVWLKYLVKR